MGSPLYPEYYSEVEKLTEELQSLEGLPLEDKVSKAIKILKRYSVGTSMVICVNDGVCQVKLRDREITF